MTHRPPITYEQIYLARKGVKAAPARELFRPKTSNNSQPNQTFEAKAIRTTTVTKTCYEYDDSEEEPHHSNATVIERPATKAGEAHPHPIHHDSRRADLINQSNRSRPRPKMIDSCVSSVRPSHVDWSGSTSSVPTEMDLMDEPFCNCNQVNPTGHDDPVPNAPSIDKCVMTDDADLEPKGCPKCKVLNTLLANSESMRLYATEVLAESSIIRAGVDPRTINPLVMKAFNEATEKGPYIPSHDMENFIRQYFEGALFNKDFSKSPFSPNQLFHVALAARDSMAHGVLHQLGTAEINLKSSYDALMSLSEAGPVRESEFWYVLDRYRRFVRDMYHIYIARMKNLQTYEKSYLSKEKLPEEAEEEVTLRMIYSKSQTVTIDGVQYDAVVIPVRRKEPV